MEEEQLDDCLLIDANEDEYKEKTRIAEVAAVTLCRLNSIMKQMKDWRDDRVKLRSNIWRLKLALRVAGKETDDTLHGDPLIEHQRAEIKRLEEANQALKKEIAEIKTSLIETDYEEEDNGWSGKLLDVKQEYRVEKERMSNEILYLRSQLKEAEQGHQHSSEVEHLKCKLKHFMMVDHTMEIILTDIVNKVAESIANLSEELVNISGHLHRTRLKNENLYGEIDRLKAMLRFKSGNTVDYQKRITELGNLTKRLKTELSKFKANLDDKAWNKESDYQNNLRNAERLANDLKSKLRNDHEALLATGDPDCLRYMKKIVDLRMILKQLHVDLSKSNDLRSRSIEKPECYNHLKQMSALESTLKQITVEIDKLKDDRVMKYCRIGGREGLEYLRIIEELELILEKLKLTMNDVNRHSESSNNEKDFEKLETFVRTVCHEMKQLEMIVVSNDSSSLHRRIEQLEDSVVNLKVESNNKEERVKSLQEQRGKDLKDAQKKISALMEENKSLKEKAKRLEEKTWDLQREQEGLKKELEQMQQIKHETNVARKKLQNIQTEKEDTSKELGKIRDNLQKKNDEIKFIIAEKDATEKVWKSKCTDLGKNLQNASKENERLQTKINDFEQKVVELSNLRRENAEMKQMQKSFEDNEIHLQRLTIELEVTKETIRNANLEIIDLKTKLNLFTEDKGKMESNISELESNISELESNKENLLYQLDIEKAAIDETQRRLTKLMWEYDELNIERSDLMRERERLKIELTDVKAQKELFGKSMGDVSAKHSWLEDEVNKYKSECSVLKELIRKFEISTEDLAGKLEEARAELNGAGDKIKRLDLKNSDLEDHVRVLLTEKNDLATRINVLDGENVSLKNQLNKVRAENEDSFVELNKLRMERDKAGSPSWYAVGETERSNGALKRSNDELRIKLNEVYSEYRILENQLRILEMTSRALEKEKKTLQRDYFHDLRTAISRVEKERASIIGDVFFTERIQEAGKTVARRLEIETKQSNMTDDDRMKGREAMKKLIVENEALKFELVNLRTENVEMKTELTRTVEQLQMQHQLARNRESEITPVPKKLEVMNLYYKEVSSYPVHYTSEITINEDSEMNIERLLEFINKLKVENLALKMEVSNLRYNFVVNFAENEKARGELWNALEERRALKTELTKLRDEKESLRVRLDTAARKLDQLEAERTALKDELFISRKTNSDLANKTHELRCNYQKLKQTNVGFECCIMGTIKKIKMYTLGDGTLDSLSNELKTLLKKCISNEEFLQSVNEQGNYFEEACTDCAAT